MGEFPPLLGFLCISALFLVSFACLGTLCQLDWERRLLRVKKEEMQYKSEEEKKAAENPVSFMRKYKAGKFIE